MPTNKQRRDAARRHLERQLQRRQEREAARRRFTLIASVVGTVVLVLLIVGFVLVVGGEGTKKPVANPSTSTSPTAPPGKTNCSFTAGGTAAKKVSLPAAQVPDTGIVSTTLKTTQGTLSLRLDRSKAPCTVASFLSLVQQKFYDSTPCHRLVTSGIYVLQCGDPKGDGSGGPGYTVPDEATGSETYPKGTVAMARPQGPNSTGSQFFVVYKDSPTLQQNLGTEQYTVLGTVSAGLDVVEKVAKGGVAGGKTDGAPNKKISITTATVAAAATASTTPKASGTTPKATGTTAGSSASP